MIPVRGDLLKHLTFSQRHGYDPLPKPMKLEEIGQELRLEIWNVIHGTVIQANIVTAAFQVFFDNTYFRSVIAVVMGKHRKVPQSDVSGDVEKIKTDIRKIIFDAPFNRLLDFLELLIDKHTSPDLAVEIGKLFEGHAAAYWLDTSKKPHKFIPCSSEAQRQATRSGIEAVQQAGMRGAETHLREAANAINGHRYADSVRESIHAVESVACKIAPRPNNTLKPALESLEKAGLLKHRALKQAFVKLYGYTNDKPGIRHALINKDAAEVDQEEAMFMFGACASFAAYLTQRHQRLTEHDAA